MDSLADESLSRRCSASFGYPEPINIWVSTFGSARRRLTDAAIARLIHDHFQLTRRGIIETLKPRRPIYRETVWLATA